MGGAKKIFTESFFTNFKNFAEMVNIDNSINIDFNDADHKIYQNLLSYKKEIINIATLQIARIVKDYLDTQNIQYDKDKFINFYNKRCEKLGKSNKSKMSFQQKPKSQKVDQSNLKDKKNLFSNSHGFNDKTHDRYAIKYNDFNFVNIDEKHIKYLGIGLWIQVKTVPKTNEKEIYVYIDKIGDKH